MIYIPVSLLSIQVYVNSHYFLANSAELAHAGIKALYVVKLETLCCKVRNSHQT